MNIDGYIRVSRVAGRSGESFISPKTQREKIQRFAKLHGHRVVKWHEDLDEPGSKESREGFQAALARVEAGETDGIAVAKLDRFARSVADAAGAIRRIQNAGGQLMSVEDNFDSSTPMGKFALHMILALAELELDRIRESWSQAQGYAVDRGVHIASKSPTGYKRGRDGRLEVVKRDAAVIADVFRQRAAGASYSDLARLLESKNVVGPYKNKHWTTAAVSKLIGNPAYTGEARSGSHRKAGAHPAIVTEAEWRAAQAARSVAPLRTGDGALLSGLLRCSGCRYVLKPDRMKARNGEKLRFYRCRGDHAAGRCPERSSVLGHLIEPYVVEQFLDALGREGVLATAVPRGHDVDELQGAVTSAEQELEEWIAASMSELGRDVYLRGLELRQQRVDVARETLDAKLGTASAVDELPAAADLRELWPDLSVAEQRRILSTGIDAVILRPGRTELDDFRVLILWRGEAPADLPTRGRRTPLAPFAWPSDRPVKLRIAAA